ncbi:hypothetical protein EC841_10546 [Raoultella ornithinolytica]|uniref:Uncharacterized protein n=1 Tax=Raoultella ornithinolytica TaxID=54291 RepID=A0ABD7QGS6_RAOOR|nr:hypothetical protein EC841_10546 [Raoultella ornithinolytica]
MFRNLMDKVVVVKEKREISQLFSAAGQPVAIQGLRQPG